MARSRDVSRSPLTAGTTPATSAPSSPPEAASFSSSRWFEPVAAVVLIGLVAIVFGRSATFNFVNFDDYTYILLHNKVTGGLTAANAWWALTSVYFANWHPITWWTWQIDASIWGPGPFGFHLTNVLLHAVNAVLVMRVVRLLTGRAIEAFLVAAVFAVHPLRWESVGWISERKDLTSAFFALLAVMSYHVYARSPGWKQMGLVTLWFALSLMSKGMAVTLPCVFLLLDWHPYGRWTSVRGVLRLLLEKWPLWILSAASCVVTVYSQEKGEAIRGFHEVTLGQRITGPIWAYAVYVGQTFWPARLAVIYEIPLSSPLWQTLLAVAVVGLLTVSAILVRRRWPGVLVGWLCYLGVLVPVIGVIQVGMQAHADRYTYLASIPLLVAIGIVISGGARRWLPPAVRTALAGAILTALGVTSFLHGATWRNSVTLWTQATRAAPCESSWWELGRACLRNGLHAEAIPAFEESCRLLPGKPDNMAGLAVALDATSQFKRAEQVARDALPLCTDTHRESEAGVRFVLAKAAARRGDPDEAARQIERALRISTDIPLRVNMAITLMRLGRPEEAIPFLRELAIEQPQDREIIGNLANALLQVGDWPAAAEAFEKGVMLAPREPRMRSRWATALLASGKIEAARAEARLVLQQDSQWPVKALEAATGMVLGPASRRTAIEEGYWLAATVGLVFESSPQAFDAMALAASGLGRFDEAEKLAGRAIEAARAAGQTDLASAIEVRQALYRKKERPSP